ncbi:uncharacterized protein LOC133511455 isoform X1 [Syngnathoides biaculeatus]|uniref:uncharacterized protein LOC133511455 isoform X1 n=1 Tax=Syngnathoides biaculeatus TaxID=300417 RepID=UPI002ADDB4AA|nr:uncharacterized protein LOC133511455 isoform X1 [Syngnathoides biaculeatus]
MNRETWLGVSFPYLKELEKKVGRKTPESFLLWMRDDVEADDHNSHFGQSFTDRLRNLKQDVRWVRSADVRILRQLAAVHEGIESARWFLSESSALDGGPTASGRAREPGVSLSKQGRSEINVPGRFVRHLGSEELRGTFEPPRKPFAPRRLPRFSKSAPGSFAGPPPRIRQRQGRAPKRRRGRGDGGAFVRLRRSLVLDRVTRRCHVFIKKKKPKNSFSCSLINNHGCMV